MTTRHKIWTTVMGLSLLAGCANRSAAAPETPAPTTAPAERSTLSGAACKEQGGQVVGDIGDGAIRRPEYRCASGLAPIADIRPSEGEPAAIEGSVCCPDAA